MRLVIIVAILILIVILILIIITTFIVGLIVFFKCSLFSYVDFLE